MGIFEVIVLIGLAGIIILLFLFRPRANNNLFALSTKMDELFASLDRIQAHLKDDLRTAREESAIGARTARSELAQTLTDFRSELTRTLQAAAEVNRDGSERAALQLDRIGERIEDQLRHRFTALEGRQNELVRTTETKLEQMRETVDEKLQRTLNERLGQSFELVAGQLERVQAGLGEMQHLAQDVGGLKKVLSNVKMRGGFGEVQLQMLLENILAPDQYAANVVTKAGSSDHVEFAIKLPNPDGDRPWIWLPVDAKFPRDVYEALQDAYESGDGSAIDSAQRTFETAIKRMARDICEKYIDPPGTAGFAVMFLPFEGIYAEVVRRSHLLEEVQRDCNIMMAGPSTLWAYLHSLQMGFRTLAIQKRTSEVWTVLGDVKKEFRKFGGMLEKAQKNIHTASQTLDEVMGKRTRAIERKLRDVEYLEDESDPLLPQE